MNKSQKTRRIASVVGGRACNKKVEEIAHNLGRKLAKVVDAIVCGGLGGTMEAVSCGFKKSGGRLSIGILPSYEKADANPYIDVALPTGLGLARNVLVVTCGDVVIALPGSAGTLSEIAYCLQFGIPVISLNSWYVPGVIRAQTVDEAVDIARSILKMKTRSTRQCVLRRESWYRNAKQKS